MNSIQGQKHRNHLKFFTTFINNTHFSAHINLKISIPVAVGGCLKKKEILYPELYPPSCRRSSYLLNVARTPD